MYFRRLPDIGPSRGAGLSPVAARCVGARSVLRSRLVLCAPAPVASSACSWRLRRRVVVVVVIVSVVAATAPRIARDLAAAAPRRPSSSSECTSGHPARVNVQNLLRT